MFLRAVNHYAKLNRFGGRSIYSNVFKQGLQPAVARINRSYLKGQVRLEVATRREFAFEKTLNDMDGNQNKFKFIFFTIVKSIFDMLKLFEKWTPQLHITKDGNIENSARSDFASYGIDTYNNEHFDAAKNLYAIPQLIWEAFIAELPDQDIVRRLNLSEHRHLWTAYSYVASASNEETRNYRIDACNRYHFYADQYHVSEDERYTKMVDNGAIANRKSHSQTELPSYMTPLYLEKFSHCPSMKDLEYIGKKYITLKASNNDDAINIDKKNEIIAALPSSKKEPEKFFEMLTADANIRAFYFMHDKSRANVFYQARNNFGLFNQLIVKNSKTFINDYCRAIVAHLVFPEVMRRLMMSQAIDTSNESIRFLTSDMLKLFTIPLTEHINFVKLNALQERWHRNITFINSKMPLSQLVTMEWYPLFPEQQINDVTFTCLTTRDQLLREGAALEHCVGGYGDRCLTGATHIIQVKTSSGERSTIELRVDGNKASVIQNFGNRNQKPCDEITNAANVLLSKINNNEIPLNESRGEIILPGMTTLSVHEVYPYPLADEAIQEEIYQAYKNAKVLPSFMMADDYKSMVAKNENVIQGMLNELKVPVPLQILLQNYGR